MAGLVARGETEAFGDCVVERLDAEFTGGELRFAIVMLSHPNPSPAEVADGVAATGLGTIPGDLPERVYLMTEGCEGAGEPGTSVTIGGQP